MADKDTDEWILGDVFMRGWYNIHDHENLRFGFVPFKGSTREPAQRATVTPSEKFDGGVDDLIADGRVVYSHGLSTGVIVAIVLSVVGVVGAGVVLALKYGLGIFMLAVQHEMFEV